MKDDVTLVTDALANGPEAFGPIVERYKDAVFGVALARLRNFHDAEDITQSAFVEAFERLDRLKDPCRLGAWLRSITIHRCVNYLRQGNRVVDIETIDEPADDSADPQTEIERQELRDQVMAAIGRLSKVQRETTTLFYINGYSQEEVARIQEVPIGTVKRRLYDARAKLKEDMIDMVEDVLKDSAPNEDFAARVFELLCAYPKGGRMWRTDTRAELKKIGTSGMEGFIKALDFPHWPTRRTAAHYLGWMPPNETIVDLLKKGLTDRNRRVRSQAVDALLIWADVTDERRRKEFIPLIVPLLFDPSKKVRHFVAGRLCWKAADQVPLETVAEALVNEDDPANRERLLYLLQKVLETRSDKVDQA